MKKILALLAGLLLTTANLYAGNGDLIVDGKIGIGLGTSSPSQKLDVNGYISLGGGSTASANLITGGTSHTNGAFLQLFGKDFSAAEGGEFLVASYGIGDIRFYNQSSSSQYSLLMTINKDGRVGMGATPAAPFRLIIAGPAESLGGIWHDSDRKFKKDIKQIDNALGKVISLAGYSYHFKTDEYTDKGFPEETQLGVIAQEVELVIPEAVMTDEEGSKAVNYTAIIPVLIEAIKAQQAEIEELKSKVK